VLVQRCWPRCALVSLHPTPPPLPARTALGLPLPAPYAPSLLSCPWYRHCSKIINEAYRLQSLGGKRFMDNPLYDTAAGGRTTSTFANPTYGSAGAVYDTAGPSPTHTEDEDGNVHV